MRIRAALVMFAVLAVSCGGGGAGDTAGAPATTAAPGTTAAPDTTATPGTTAAAETTTTAEEAGATAEAVTVATADSDLGEILVDAEGRTLYVFDNDTGGESTCYEQCAELWPPLLAEGDAQAAEGADASLLGTTARTDGSTQVTYDGRPLYYYTPDTSPGDTNGQGVGGVWWVMAPSGEAITEAAGAEADGAGY